MGRAAALVFTQARTSERGEQVLHTDEEDVARKIRMTREHGQLRKYYHEMEGYNGRLDALRRAFSM